MTVAPVLLAAGSGSRFDEGTKLLAEIAGKPLIRRAIEAAIACGLPAPYVVTGGSDLAGWLEDVIEVPNEAWEEGLASSLRAGISAASRDGFDAVVVALADQPGISPDAWRAVADASTTPIAVATYSGKRVIPCVSPPMSGLICRSPATRVPG